MTERPVLRVVSGAATPEEIAAVVAAVAAATSAEGSSAGASSGAATSTADPRSGSRTTSLWSAPGYAHRNIRTTSTPGPDGWRTSFWPR